MKKTKLKWILILSMILIVLQSCTTNTDSDIEIIESEEEISSLSNDLIISWSDQLLALDQYATGMRPNATARALAYIHLATFETAVDDMTGYTSNTLRLDGLDIDASERASNINLAIALNACYADVLDHFIYNVPENIKQGIQTLESATEEELSMDIEDDIIENSKNWGAYVASQVIAYSQTDLEAEEQILDPQPSSYEPPVGDGFWTYSAEEERGLFPYWASVRTFVISPEETTTVPPSDQYSSNENSGYYAQMKEVYKANNLAKSEQDESLWIAEFWSDDVENLMISPPGRQISIAKQLIEQYDLGIEESLVMLLKLGFSLNDAAVSTWDDKYKYLVMRPSVYIHEFIDPDYQTNLYKFIYWPNPTFPGYPSGHSCFSSAAAGVFINQFGNATDFTDRTHEGRTEFNGTPRQFDSFSEMAEENAFSRIPLGVHIRMDCTEGIRLGYEISDAVNSMDLSSSSN